MSLKLRAKNKLHELVKKVGARARPIVESYGYDVIKRHYYSPVPDRADIPEGYWDQVFEMPGIDLRLDKASVFLDEVVALHIDGFRARFPINNGPGVVGFYLINGSYMAVDAHVYWCMIQHYKPKRIIEVGGGCSTMVSTAAIEHLKNDNGHECGLTVIEPYPIDFIKHNAGELFTLRELKIQEVSLDVFAELQDGDFLFIDSTHVLRENSDVQFEYLQILPRLNPGVFVHIHDISLPKPYPEVYFNMQIFWNEQYLLQAFLAFNDRFEVTWPGNAMMLAEPEKMIKIIPEINDMRNVYTSSEPTAFWMRSKTKTK
jgi:hypothetical protein